MVEPARWSRLAESVHDETGKHDHMPIDGHHGFPYKSGQPDSLPAAAADEEYTGPIDPISAYQKRRPTVKRSALEYTPGNLQMMKEYGMSEEEWALEFGGRPHQQRQSPVARSDLRRFWVPYWGWNFCSHKLVPLMLCRGAVGGILAASGRHCGHELHEYELCQCSEMIRGNQVLQKKKRAHAMYTESERNWMYNDPDWGHMVWRSKYGAWSIRAKFGMGYGARCEDPPSHEISMSQNVFYNPDIQRTEPHPWWHMHKLRSMAAVGYKQDWNRWAMWVPLFDGDRCPDCTIPFDPRRDGGFAHPW